MSDEIDSLKAAAGAYKKDALEARKKFIELRHRQDVEIRKLFMRTADRVAEEIRGLSPTSSPLRLAHLQELEKGLRQEAEKLNGDLTKALTEFISEAVEGGAGFSRAVTVNLLEASGLPDLRVDKLFQRVNVRAVKACWDRTQKELKLSDRIWQNSENLMENVREIVREAVVLGQDAVQTARLLEQYVRKDTKTLTKSYPHMMEHLKGRVPEDLSYEALRLARTETTAAFGKATVDAAQASPSYKGLKWVLSKSHPVRDICDELAAHDEGLGLGVYAPGNEPYFPAHPNDMCFLVPVHDQPEDFVKRLKQWKSDPGSDPGIEKWYQKTYRDASGE